MGRSTRMQLTLLAVSLLVSFIVTGQPASAQISQLDGCSSTRTLDALSGIGVPDIFDSVLFNVSLTSAGFELLASLGRVDPLGGILTLTSVEIAPGPNCTAISLFTTSAATPETAADTSGRSWALYDIFSFSALEQTAQFGYPSTMSLDLTSGPGLALSSSQRNIGLMFRCTLTSSGYPSLFATYYPDQRTAQNVAMSRAYVLDAFPVANPADLDNTALGIFYGAFNTTVGNCANASASSSSPRPPFPPLSTWPPRPPPAPPPPPPSPSVLAVRMVAPRQFRSRCRASPALALYPSATRPQHSA